MPVKPTEREEEYFVRIEQEMKKQREEQRKKQASKEQREKLRELHFMKCPKCGRGTYTKKWGQCTGCGLGLRAGELGGNVIHCPTCRCDVPTVGTNVPTPGAKSQNVPTFVPTKRDVPTTDVGTNCEECGGRSREGRYKVCSACRKRAHREKSR